MNLEKELKLAKELAVKAGEAILEIYNKDFEVEYKDDKSPLTEADKTANDIIVKSLAKKFPEYSILSEESKDDKSRLVNDYCWIVDPLDGTKEFIKKNGEFTVNIALSYKKESVLGVIYAPVLKELYYACKGYGSFLEVSGKSKQLRCSDKTEDLIVVASRSHMSDKLKDILEKNNINKTVNMGSSLKGCLIAKGEADLYYRLGLTSEWDTAAMQCIVEEAGGVFMQLDDTPMFYNRENNLNEKGFYILNKIENKLNME